MKLDFQKHQFVIDVLQQEKVDGLLIISKVNRGWYSHLFCGWGYLFLTTTRAILLVDERYGEVAAQVVPNCEIIVTNTTDFFTKMVALVEDLGITTLGVESTVELGFYQLLVSKLSHLVQCRAANVKALRLIKSDAEIVKLRAVCATTCDLLAIIQKRIVVGQTREMDIRQWIFEYIIDQGLDPIFPDPIINSGPKGSLPHGHPSNRIIVPGEMVTIDLGVVKDGFYSDMTRTFITKGIDKQLQEIYAIVLRAQTTAIQAARPGITAAQLDAIARQVIIDAGYGPQFLHPLGHGLGLEVHEAPRLASYDQTELAPGMVITIEPGIYLPDVGGVRIEDDLLITSEGCEVLTPYPKDAKSITI